jgi:hypothetical protein
MSMRPASTNSGEFRLEWFAKESVMHLLHLTIAAIWFSAGSLLGGGYCSPADGAEPRDKAEAGAVATIEALGGSVRQISRSTNDREVEFHLSGRDLTDEGLEHIAQLGNVVLLNLRGTKITNAGLVHLKGLTKLRELHLEQTDVGDDGLVNLSGMTNLKYLNLYGTSVTDKGLQHLAGLNKLKCLYVWQTEVTDEGVAKLAQALPELEIVRGVDFSKLPAPPPVKQLVPVKWVAAGSEIPPKSNSGSNTEVIFENKSDQRVKVVWIGYDGKPRLYHELNPGETKRQNTYANNTWLITDESDKPLGHFLIGPDVARAVIPKQK